MTPARRPLLVPALRILPAFALVLAAGAGASASTISLRCGATYPAPLDLRGKSNVTVRTEGSCGRATITPARPVTGWSIHAGRIYSAPLSFAPLQVAVDGVPLAPAHWPASGWAAATSAPPRRELAGATLFWLENQSVVKTRQLAGNGIGAGPAKPFYVAGKLWMLDSPGEWAVEGGRLYLWAPDGKSPEGRVLAAPAASGIDAANSHGIAVDGVRIWLAANGISAEHAANLAVRDSVIQDSAFDGIRAGGSSGLLVDGSRVDGSGRNGIDGWYWITGATITNTSVTNTGMRAMPAPSEGAIMFGDGRNNRIDHVQVANSAYHGIVVLHNRDSSVDGSSVDKACLRLADCGGIYTVARDRQPLGLRIEHNTVANVKGREAAGIYLDDSANGVTVSGNTVSGSTRGMLLHDAFGNAITDNTFAANGVAHLAFSQSAPGSVHHNLVARNAFRTAGAEQTFNLEGCADPSDFGSFDYNTYAGAGSAIFARVWDGYADAVDVDFRRWQGRLHQDAHSAHGAGGAR